MTDEVAMARDQSCSSDDSSIECAQRSPPQPLMDISVNAQDQQSDEPTMYKVKLSSREYRSFKRALKIPGFGIPLPNGEKNDNVDTSALEDHEEDWYSDESISDFEDPPSDEEPVREVPVETFVQSSRIIYADGRVTYFPVTKEN